jgi:hypothetical protein
MIQRIDLVGGQPLAERGRVVCRLSGVRAPGIGTAPLQITQLSETRLGVSPCAVPITCCRPSTS